MQSEGWTYEVHELSEGFSAIVYDQHGQMVADHLTEKRARLIAASPTMADAANRLLTVFDQQRMTTAERIIAGISEAGLRTEGNAAIEALRAALSLARDREPG